MGHITATSLRSGTHCLGPLKEGDRLPTVKDVARQTAVNPNTVLKAYRELETGTHHLAWNQGVTRAEKPVPSPAGGRTMIAMTTHLLHRSGVPSAQGEC